MEWKIDDAFKFGAKIGSKHSNSSLSISSCFAPCSSRFTLGGESRQKNLADSQKSSWTGFVWFYRVSLRFIEFYRATSPPPLPLFHSSRFLLAPSSRKTIRGLPKKRGEERAENKIAVMQFSRTVSGNLSLWFVVVVGANTLEFRSLDILYQSPPLLSTTMRLLLTCFHFFFLKFTKQCEFHNDE